MLPTYLADYEAADRGLTPCLQLKHVAQLVHLYPAAIAWQHVAVPRAKVPGAPGSTPRRDVRLLLEARPPSPSRALQSLEAKLPCTTSAASMTTKDETAAGRSAPLPIRPDPPGSVIGLQCSTMSISRMHTAGACHGGRCRRRGR